MIAGYDKRGPAIFKVDSEGQRVQLRLCSIGSGSLRCVLHKFELLKDERFFSYLQTCKAREYMQKYAKTDFRENWKQRYA